MLVAHAKRHGAHTRTHTNRTGTRAHTHTSRNQPNQKQQQHKQRKLSRNIQYSNRTHVSTTNNRSHTQNNRDPRYVTNANQSVTEWGGIYSMSSQLANTCEHTYSPQRQLKYVGVLRAKSSPSTKISTIYFGKFSLSHRNQALRHAVVHAISLFIKLTIKKRVTSMKNCEDNKCNGQAS